MEPSQVDESHPAGERFGNALDEPRGSAAEKQELRAVSGTVHEHADRLEQGGLALDLVDDDQAFESGERLFGRGQPALADSRLEIEVRARRVLGRDPSGQRGLPALARAGERDTGMHREFFPDAMRWCRPFNVHAAI